MHKNSCVHDVRLVLERLAQRRKCPPGLVFPRAKTEKTDGKEGTLRLSAVFAAFTAGAKSHAAVVRPRVVFTYQCHGKLSWMMRPCQRHHTQTGQTGSPNASRKSFCSVEPRLRRLECARAGVVCPLGPSFDAATQAGMLKLTHANVSHHRRVFSSADEVGLLSYMYGNPCHDSFGSGRVVPFFH